MRRLLILFVTLLSAASSGFAEPRAGQPMPAFSVNDLEGTRHTQRDLLGSYTVICTLTDKDSGPAVEAWWRPLEIAIPAGTPMLTFTALDIFGLVPTGTILSQARERTPRPQWRQVWFSRDGSLAESLGLESDETPWVFVVDPRGRVVVSIHAAFSAAGLARVVGAIPRAPTRMQPVPDAGAQPAP